MRRQVSALLAVALFALSVKPARPQGVPNLLLEKGLELALDRVVSGMFPVPNDTPTWAIELHEDIQRVWVRLLQLSDDVARLQWSVSALPQTFAHNDLKRAINTAKDHRHPASPSSRGQTRELENMMFANAVTGLQNAANGLLDAPECDQGMFLGRPAPEEAKECKIYTEVALVADAMGMEAAMYQALGTSPEDRFVKYEQYFNQALGSDSPDMLRRIWSVFHKDAQTRQAALDATAASGTWLCNIGSSHKNGPGESCRFALYQPVKGSLERGYCFADTSLQWLYPDECRQPRERNIDRPEHTRPGSGQFRYTDLIVPAAYRGAGSTPATPATPTVPVDRSGLFSRGLEATAGPDGCVGQAALQGDGQGPPHNSTASCPGEMTRARQEYQRAATNANYVYMLIQLACRARQAAGELSRRFDPSWHGAVVVCDPKAYADPLPDAGRVATLDLDGRRQPASSGW